MILVLDPRGDACRAEPPQRFGAVPCTREWGGKCNHDDKMDEDPTSVGSRVLYSRARATAAVFLWSLSNGGVEAAYGGRLSDCLTEHWELKGVHAIHAYVHLPMGLKL